MLIEYGMNYLLFAGVKLSQSPLSLKGNYFF